MPECEWCGVNFDRPNTRGPVPKYCASAHRQAAFRSRHPKPSYVRRLEAALEFYADPASYAALAIIPDPPCGAFYYDVDDANDPDFDGYRYGAFARAALRNEDYDPPLDHTDYLERHPDPEADG